LTSFKNSQPKRNKTGIIRQDVDKTLTKLHQIKPEIFVEFSQSKPWCCALGAGAIVHGIQTKLAAATSTAHAASSTAARFGQWTVGLVLSHFCGYETVEL